MTERRIDDHWIHMEPTDGPVSIPTVWTEPRAETPYTYITASNSDYQGEQRPQDRGYYARTFGGRRS